LGYGSGMVPWEMSRLLETIELSTGSGEWFSGNNRSSGSEFIRKSRENMSRLFLTSLRLETLSQREESWQPHSSVLSARDRSTSRRLGDKLLADTAEHRYDQSTCSTKSRIWSARMTISCFPDLHPSFTRLEPLRVRKAFSVIILLEPFRPQFTASTFDTDAFVLVNGVRLMFQ